MKSEKHLVSVLDHLKADRAEKRQGRELWRGLVNHRPEDAPLDPLLEHLLQQAVTLRILSQRLMGAIPKEPMLDTEKPLGGRPAKPSVHPAYDSLVKTQERLGKVMKQLREELDVTSGDEVEGVPEMMVSILKEAEGVLENALRPGKRGKGNERAGDEGREDREVADDS